MAEWWNITAIEVAAGQWMYAADISAHFLFAASWKTTPTIFQSWQDRLRNHDILRTKHEISICAVQDLRASPCLRVELPTTVLEKKKKAVELQSLSFSFDGP